MLTNWKGPDLTSYGELVLEGTFRIQKAKKERTLFLLDQLLLITKKRDDTFTYKAHILVGPHGVACEAWGWGGCRFVFHVYLMHCALFCSVATSCL